MTKRHVLIVEDEKKIADVLCDYLGASGYTTCQVARGDLVIPHIKQSKPDIILLDIMLPGLNGMDICREIRKFSSLPIIMITAKVEEIDRLIGLEIGADDYICKPFSPREVVARVKAILRRVYRETESDNLAVGPVLLKQMSREVWISDHLITLTPSEFNLLKLLMSHPGRVFSRRELVDKILGYDFDGYDRTIDTHVKNLRKKIASRLPDIEIIISVYGVGYKFDANVTAEGGI